tara:strand:- start:31 stop:237 length:207 start_codon:yes stop_codon:yes gene_type:complete
MGRADEPTPKRCFESVQLGITPGGGGRRGESRRDETEKVVARSVRPIRVLFRLLEKWTIEVGNETHER